MLNFALPDDILIKILNMALESTVYLDWAGRRVTDWGCFPDVADMLVP